MSKFFDDVDDSDEETMSDQTVSEDDHSDNGDSDMEIDKKWLLGASDDDDSDDDEKVVLSKPAKAMKELEELSDQMDLETAGNQWTKGYTSFDKLRKKAEDYASRFGGGIRPATFISTLLPLTESCSAKLTREDCDNKEDFVHYGKLTKALVECCEVYKADIERQQRIDEGVEEAQGQTPEEEAKDQGEDWSKEGMLKMLETLHLAKNRSQNKTLRGIITHATQIGHYSLVTSATSQLASNTLEDELHQVSHVPHKQWKSAFDLTVKTYAQCTTHGFAITEGIDPEKITEKNTAVVPFYTLIDSLYERYLQAMQFNHNDTAGLMPRVQEEQPFFDFASKMLVFYEARGTKKAILKLAIILLDIAYSRTANQHAALCVHFSSENTETVGNMVARLHETILNRGSPDQKTMANLQLAYHLALTNKYHDARDLMLQAGLVEEEFTGSLQVAGNRAVAQLGLCAFRNGFFVDCNTILGDLCARTIQQMKILLGQDIAFVRDNAAKELRFRSRLVPAHRHMMTELIEAAALCSSMLLSVVSEAKKPFERGNRPHYLQKLISQQSMALMTGAPANLKEAIFHCYQGIEKGTIACEEGDNKSGMSMPIFESAIWNSLGDSKDAVFESLLLEVKVAALKVFLIKNGASYNSLAVEHLVAKFGLEANKVRSIVSQLLLDRDHVIIGYWDAEEKFLTIERGSTSKMHHLADHGADRLSQLAGGAPSRFDRRGKRPYRARQ